MRQGFGHYRLERGQVNLFRLLGWRGLLVLAVAAALLVATLVAAASLFIVLLPVFLVAGLVARLVYAWRRKNRAQGPAARASAERVIEGSYEVIPDGRADERPSSGEGRPGGGWGRPGPG